MTATAPPEHPRRVPCHGLVCEVCGRPAVAFYPGAVVDHGGGLGCDVRRRTRVRLRQPEQQQKPDTP